jgi:UDP-N-acetylmuramoylalanine--D-glutamate ligase
MRKRKNDEDLELEKIEEAFDDLSSLIDATAEERPAELVEAEYESWNGPATRKWVAEDVAGKLFAVIGLARAGLPAARFLAERGARVIGYDSRPLDELGLEAKRLLGLGVEIRNSENGYEGLEKCQAIVLSPGLRIHQDPLKTLLEGIESWGTEVIGELELAFRFCPAPIIAVTGTKGKSTTTKLIAEMLEAAGEKVVRAGNTGTPLIAGLSTLDEDSWAVVEVSSFQLEKAPTFHPRISVLLNLLPDHLDYHPTLFQYWSTKLKIFANQTPGDVAVFNTDDPAVAALVNGESDFMNVRDTIQARIMIASARQTPRAAEAKVIPGREWVGWEENGTWIPLLPLDGVPLRGPHNVSNIAAAVAAVGAALGESVIEHRPAIVERMRSFESLPHRLEIVGNARNLTWVNDSQATIPAATVAALQSFEPPITLIAGGQAKLDEASFDVLGQAIVKCGATLITIGDAEIMLADMAARHGLADDKIIEAHTLQQAIIKARQVTPPGGTVLLSPACASFDQFKSYEERGEKFREFVKRL